MLTKFSIITSCYNREATLRNSIRSVLLQDYNDVEYIIIDGASKDKSLDIIREYQDRIAKIVSEPDRGMYEAINEGIKMATGDVVGLMHSDDEFYSPHVLTEIAACFEETDADIVYGDGLFVDNRKPCNVVRNWISGSFARWKIRCGWLPLHTTVYIKRAVFDKIGFYDESYKIASDSDFLLRCLYESDFKIVYLHRYIVRMQMGGMSTDRAKRKQMWQEDIRLYRQHGFSPYLLKIMKMLWKVPQFITAKFVNL